MALPSRSSRRLPSRSSGGRRVSAGARPDADGPADGGRRLSDGEEPDGPPAPDADPVAVARQICLAQLDAAPRTRAELAATLAQRGVPDDAAQEVLSRFADVGLIDDALFARLWVDSRHRGRGLAGRALRQELRRKGVEEDLIGEAVEGLDPEREAATARSLVDRKLRATRGLATEVRVRRLVGMLARKGYPAGTAFRVVREALADEGSADEELLDALDAQQ